MPLEFKNDDLEKLIEKTADPETLNWLKEQQAKLGDLPERLGQHLEENKPREIEGPADQPDDLGKSVSQDDSLRTRIDAIETKLNDLEPEPSPRELTGATPEKVTPATYPFGGKPGQSQSLTNLQQRAETEETPFPAPQQVRAGFPPDAMEPETGIRAGEPAPSGQGQAKASPKASGKDQADPFADFMDSIGFPQFNSVNRVMEKWDALQNPEHAGEEFSSGGRQDQSGTAGSQELITAIEDLVREVKLLTDTIKEKKDDRPGIQKDGSFRPGGPQPMQQTQSVPKSGMGGGAGPWMTGVTRAIMTGS